MAEGKAGGAAGEVWGLLLINCRVASMCVAESKSASGAEYGAVEGTGAVGVADGRIAFVGSQDALPSTEYSTLAREVRDCQGRWVTPGLIDCHTHIVYGGNRAGEWELKLKGATYEEVAQAGGGIVNTVEGTRSASVAELVDLARPRVEALLAEGVTTMEIKSGYGLELEAERKSLQAARAIGSEYDLEVVSAFLGAHAIPREYAGRGDAYIAEVVKMVGVLAGEGLVDSVDAFCETIGFSVEQTKLVFDEARRLQIPIRLHGDQLHDFGGANLASEYNALSCDHCEYTSEAGAKAMAAAGSVAVLLPTANYFIKETKRPPVDLFRQEGVDMAIATNCNPGSSPCTSILLCLNMACTIFGMTPEEAFLGVTRNAARAVGKGDTHGTLEVGKVGDLCVWDVESPCEIAYYLGLNRLTECFKEGRLRA